MNGNQLRAALLVALFILSTPFAVRAQVADDRVAFVIGNATYPKPLALKNPLNDASAIEKQLSTLGFETKSYKDLKVAEVSDLRKQMESRLKPNSVLFFYYAGHGVQIDGRNYLLPVDASLNDSERASKDGLYLGDILYAIERMRPKIAVVILDACRDNPFKDKKNPTDSKQGLARVDPPTSTVVFYATRPGGTAQDGEEENGVFTKALLQEMVKPEQPLEVVFRRVSTSVFKFTKSEQEPWIEGVIREEFVITKVDPKPILLDRIELASDNKKVEKEPVLEIPNNTQALVESQPISKSSFDEAISKIKSIRNKSSSESEPTYFACNGDNCENYQNWIKRFSDESIQNILKKSNAEISDASFFKICEYDLEKNICNKNDVRFPFYGSNLILTNTYALEGFGITNSQITKSGGISFSAKMKVGGIWYFGNKVSWNCGQTDAKLAYERDKVSFEVARSLCLGLALTSNKSALKVLLFDYSKNEFIAELDQGLFGVGLGLFNGGGKKIVKLSIN